MLRLSRYLPSISLFGLLMAPIILMADISIKLDELQDRFPDYQADVVAVVNVAQQELSLYEHGEVVATYPVSTAEKGVGNRKNSYQTPTGVHFVRDKIGAGAAELAIFKSRLNTRRIAKIETRPRHTGDDLVTTRILWLSGLEPGINQGKGVDSYRRYIYIHGTHEEGLIGQPASHGCVRMINTDVIELFELMPERSLVWIVEQ